MKSQLKVSWKRIAIALAIVFGALWLVVGIMTYFEPWYLARHLRNDPKLSLLPAPLPDKTVAPLRGAAIEVFEFSFGVPWEAIESQKKAPNGVAIKFKDGPGVMVFVPSGTSMGTQIADVRTATDRERLVRIFGARALSSDYDFMAAELAATPAGIKWWDRYSTAKTRILLELKSIALLNATAIYQVANRELRGFQIGDPAVQPTQVELKLYDVNNRGYQIWIFSKAVHVSQSQINAIVASVKPIPHS